MSILLDTHVWIWSQESPMEIGRTARELLEDRQQSIFVSTVSTLEISRLRVAGVIELEGSLISWVNDTLEALSCATISISHEIASTAYELPGAFHKDPADRLLVATARLHELQLMTADARILEYPHVYSLDARR